MLDWIEIKVDEVTTLFQGASVLGAILMVAVAYYKTRTIVAVIVAAITAGVFLWTINNADWWQERVEEESDVAPPFGPAPDGTPDDPVVVVQSPLLTTT